MTNSTIYRPFVGRQKTLEMLATSSTEIRDCIKDISRFVMHKASKNLDRKGMEQIFVDKEHTTYSLHGMDSILSDYTLPGKEATVLSRMPPFILRLVLEKIYVYDEIAKLRSVNRLFNQLCMQQLNRGFRQLGIEIDAVKTTVKKELPKRESQRRNHRLSRLSDIYGSLDTRYSLMSMTYKKFTTPHTGRLLSCFIPGKVIDEYLRLMGVLKRYYDTGGAFTGDSIDLLKDVRDLSSMAMEHYEEQVLPYYESKGYFQECSRIGYFTPNSAFSIGVKSAQQKLNQFAMYHHSPLAGMSGMESQGDIPVEPCSSNAFLGNRNRLSSELTRSGNESDETTNNNLNCTRCEQVQSQIEELERRDRLTQLKLKLIVGIVPSMCKALQTVESLEGAQKEQLAGLAKLLEDLEEGEQETTAANEKSGGAEKLTNATLFPLAETSRERKRVLSLEDEDEIKIIEVKKRRE